MGDYFGITPIISLILLIIPLTAWILGALTRFKEGHYIAGLIRLFFFGLIIWVCDVFMTLTHGCQVTLLRLLTF